MKLIFLKKNTKTQEHSFAIEHAIVPHTYDHFHYHPEYELMYAIRNSGVRYIGDSVHSFEDGDLVLVGPNIPHFWRSDQEFYTDDNLNAEVVVSQFMGDFMGNDFMNLAEMSSIVDLLERAKRGIRIKGKDAKTIGRLFATIPHQKGCNKLLTFIKVLDLMANAKDFDLLTSENFPMQITKKGFDQVRINKILDYMASHYKEPIDLIGTAKHANMSVSAFCRYFKKMTSKTFSEMLNEIRIGIACKQLATTNDTILEVCYDNGFSNISYFNRVFRKIKLTTPSAYRHLHTIG